MQELNQKELAKARQLMTKQQINAWGVNNPRALDVLSKTAREDFLPAKFNKVAYCDEKLPIGHECFSTEPKIIGRALEALDIQPSDDVLEIGVGTGYLTALIAQLSYHVTSVEIKKDFINQAQNILTKKRISNFHLVNQDIFEYLEQRPSFNVIICTSATEKIPSEFLQAIKPEGRLFCIIGKEPAMEACLWEKDSGGKVKCTSLFETVAPYLTNSKRSVDFEF